MPDHRHKPGDDHAGGRKPRGKKPRPDGFRHQGPRPDGPRPDAPRFEGPRPDGPALEGPKSFGPRPGGSRPGGGFGGPRPGGPRRDGGFAGPRPFGHSGPRPGGPRSGGGFGGPRPSGPRRDGGFGGPRPGGTRPNDFDAPPFDRNAETPERDAPAREWQPRAPWTPRPFGHSGPRQGGPRPGGGFGGPRPAGPRPEGGFDGPHPNSGFGGPRRSGPGPRPGGFDGPRREGGFAGPRPGGFGGPRPGGPRPGGFGGPRQDSLRPERGGFGFGERAHELGTQRPPRPEPADHDFIDLPPEVAGFGPAESVPPTEAFEPSEAPRVDPADAAGFEPDESAPSTESFTPAGRTPRPARRPDYRTRSGGYPDRRPFRPGQPAQAGWSRPPASPPSSDLLGEDEEIVAGRHPVEEAFVAHRKAVRLLVVPQRRLALEKLVLHATNLRIPIVEVEGGTLTSLAGFDGHQGIAVVTDRRQFAGLDDLLARAIERKEAPFIIVLDSLEDPQNFGSLLRTAEASGVQGVVYPTHRQAPLSPAAIKASAGAVEHLLMVPVEDLADALTDLHVRGLRIIGTDADASLTARQADLRGPVAIVVGSEGQGLGPAVRRRCDAVVRIPMRGHVTSLNAAVAGSILLYEASSQRGGERPLIAPESTADMADPAALDSARGPADEAPVPIDDGSEAQVALPASEPKARRRATPKASAPKRPRAHPGDELLPGGPEVDLESPTDSPAEAGRGRA